MFPYKVKRSDLDFSGRMIIVLDSFLCCIWWYWKRSIQGNQTSFSNCLYKSWYKVSGSYQDDSALYPAPPREYSRAGTHGNLCKPPDKRRHIHSIWSKSELVGRILSVSHFYAWNVGFHLNVTTWRRAFFPVFFPIFSSSDSD